MVMKRGRVFSSLVFIVLSTAVFGVEIKPTNISIPSPGGTFSFDFVASSATSSINAQFVQLTIDSISGPAGIAFTWNGTVGDYIFTLDRNIVQSYAYLDNFTSAPVALPTGQWYTNPIVNA